MPAWTKETILPPWPKDHVVKLAPPEVYETAQNAGGRDTLERHHPLTIADHYGDKPRRAGTHSVHDTVEDALPIPAVDRVRSDERIRNWQERLKDPNSVISVRDVKKATPDFKVTHPMNHAFARYVLPVAENEIKSQDWPGKKRGDEDKGTEKRWSDDKENRQVKQEGPELSDEQQAFLDRLFDEIHQVESFKNNPGEPQEKLALLDGDALKQLESHLSIDDQSTPDSWIPRYPGLLRLTGKHPLNAEPNLVDLYNAGMVTPTKLPYVRSHGAVPQLSWETHRLSVFSDPEGLIASPKEWSMDEVAFGGFKVIEIPVTFGCDGYRRKELNMTKKTAGFNFTGAAVSTCLWRGIMVRDLLLASGLRDQPDEERWYLNFEGADSPSEGPYATSIPLLHAMNRANDVILVSQISEKRDQSVRRRCKRRVLR